MKLLHLLDALFQPIDRLVAHLLCARPPARRGRGNKVRGASESEAPTPCQRRAAVTWAQRLKRVFKIDIETCSVCGGEVKIIAAINDPIVIEKILNHLNEKATGAEPTRLPKSRVPLFSLA